METVTLNSRNLSVFNVYRKRMLAIQSALIIVNLSRKALLITETELKLIAKAAIIGDNNQPVNGNNKPAAIGTPSML